MARRADVVLGVSGDLVRRLRAAGARDARPAVVTAPETGAPLKGRRATREDLLRIAKTLGLPDTAVTKGTVGGTADISVVLGTDYKG